jgi:hypothetical protein
MNFISIHQYFNKLQIVFLILLIIPLLAFIALYFLTPERLLAPRLELYIIVSLAAALDWILAMKIFNKKIKSVRNEQGLGAKLDKYFYITIVRYSFLSSSGLVLAVGFFLTQGDLFTALYLVNLIGAVLLWPTGPRIARELALRGDERDMVYFKKDLL